MPKNYLSEDIDQEVMAEAKRQGGTISAVLNRYNSLMQNKYAKINIDREYTQCIKCKKGKYRETSIQDDWDGVVHCTRCGHEVNRYSMDDIKRKEAKPYITLKNGSVVETYAEFNNGYSHIIIDDGCYVIVNGKDGEAEMSSHIFPEALKVLKYLPALKE